MIDRLAIESALEVAGLQRAAVAVIALDHHPRLIALRTAGEIYPASMIKTPLAVAVAAAEQAGRLRWSDRVLIDPTNVTLNDAPSPLAAGGTAEVWELVDLMLARSDNVATNVLIDLVDRSRATAELAALGFPATAIRRKLSGALPLIADAHATGRNAHPVGEAVELFARLANGTVPGSQRICTALAQQYWNTKLSSGLAPGDTFAHKTGDTDEVSHDGGILTLHSGERYAIVVYTELPSNARTDGVFGAFMRELRRPA